MTSKNNKDIEKESEEIEATIKETEKFVSVFLLNNLRGILNEQVKAKLLKREVADYIYKATRQAAVDKGWIEK